MGRPVNGIHDRTGRLKGKEGGQHRENSQGFLPTHLQEPQQGRERGRDTAETLHAATAKSATQQKRKRGNLIPDRELESVG